MEGFVSCCFLASIRMIEILNCEQDYYSKFLIDEQIVIFIRNSGFQYSIHCPHKFGVSLQLSCLLILLLFPQKKK